MGLRFRKSFTVSKGVEPDIGEIAQDFNFGSEGLRRIMNISEKNKTDNGFLREILSGNIEEYRGDAKAAVNE